MVLYSYPPFGHIADLGCRFPVERFNQEQRVLDGRRLRIGGRNMKKMKSLGLGLVVMALVALLCGADAVWGQDVTATITGTVTDPSGAALAGVTVTAKEADRGTIWSAQTNEAGIFSLLRIPIGTSHLTPQMNGFKTPLRPPFTL